MNIAVPGFRKLFRAPLTALLLTHSAAGTAYAVDDGALQIFVNREQRSLIEALARQFEDDNPGARVELVNSSLNARREPEARALVSRNTPPDLIIHQTGSLLHALRPEIYLTDLSSQGFAASLAPAFTEVVGGNGAIYGVPVGTMMFGGFFYNREIYERYNLEIPKDWPSFLQNVSLLKGTGVTPVLQGNEEPWASQIITLADYHNLRAAEPDFAEKLTANETRFAETEAAFRSFRLIEDLVKIGAFNSDARQTSYTEAIRRLAAGEGAHYPMHSMLITVMSWEFPDSLEKIGFFPVPPDEPSDGGATFWMPSALYMPLNAPHPALALRFLAYAVSEEACRITVEQFAAVGAFAVTNCDDVKNPSPMLQEILDDLAQKKGNSAALEFFTPLKGPALEFILADMVDGKLTAEAAARAYDRDIRKRALSLRLEAWMPR